MSLLAIALMFVDSTTVIADSIKVQPLTNAVAGGPVITVFTYIKVILILAFVIAIILLSVKLLKKLSPQLNRTGDGNAIKIISSTWLGPKKSLYLIKIASKYLLIGVTENNINLLREIDDQQDISSLEGPLSSNTGGQNFSSVLTSFFRKTGN